MQGGACLSNGLMNVRFIVVGTPFRDELFDVLLWPVGVHLNVRWAQARSIVRIENFDDLLQVERPLNIVHNGILLFLGDAQRRLVLIDE